MNHICSNHIQNANISSFIRTWQSIKYWLKVSTKPSNCHFSDRRANLGCGCLQHWELDLDCCSSTQGDFHARSPAVQHSDRGISLFKAHAFFFSWRSHPSSSFFLFFFLLVRAVLNIHKYKNVVETPLVTFWFCLLKKKKNKRKKKRNHNPAISHLCQNASSEDKNATVPNIL